MAEYNFNLPPITQLSLDQQNALNEPNPIALSGGPGTGKTVVSIFSNALLLSFLQLPFKYIAKVVV